jgi:hypothetical protein
MVDQSNIIYMAMHFERVSDNINNNKTGVLRDIAPRLYQGLLYFQSVAWFQGICGKLTTLPK